MLLIVMYFCDSTCCFYYYDTVIILNPILYWSMCLFMCQYNAFLLLWSCNNFKSRMVTVPSFFYSGMLQLARMLCASIWITTFVSYFCKEWCWNCDQGCNESAGSFVKMAIFTIQEHGGLPTYQGLPQFPFFVFSGFPTEVTLFTR